MSGESLGRGLVLMAALCAGLAGPVSAQVYHIYPAAPVVPDDHPAAGAAFGIGDDLQRLLGFARFNIVPKADLGLELVFDRLGGDWRTGLGADVKYAIVPKTNELPFDLSVQGGFGFQTGSFFSNFDIPVGAVISRPLELDSGRQIVPFGGLYLIVRRLSLDAGPSDTDIDVELRGGASFEVFDSGDAFITIHAGSDVMFFVGYNAHM